MYAIAAYAILGINVNALADKRSNVEVVEPPKTLNRQPFVPSSGRGFINSWR